MLQSAILLRVYLLRISVLSILVKNRCSSGRHSCGKQTDTNDKRRDVSAVPRYSDQSIREPNGETTGVGSEQSKEACICGDCNGELAGVASCLAVNPCVRFCNSCQKKKKKQK